MAITSKKELIIVGPPAPQLEVSAPEEELRAGYVTSAFEQVFGTRGSLGDIYKESFDKHNINLNGTIFTVILLSLLIICFSSFQTSSEALSPIRRSLPPAPIY